MKGSLPDEHETTDDVTNCQNGPSEETCKPMLKNQTNSMSSSPDAAPVCRGSQMPTRYVFGRWVVYLCAVLNFGLSISLPIAMSVMFLDWQEAFQVSRAHTVTVHSTLVGILFAGAIIPGYLMNRLGARFTVLLGSFLASLGCITSCFATSINFLVITTGVLGGSGFCFIQLPSMPVVSTVFSPRYRSIAVAWCSCGVVLCNMAFPFLYRYLIHHYSWRGAFGFISGISLQTAVLGLVMTSHVKEPSTLQEVVPCVDEFTETKQNSSQPNYRGVHEMETEKRKKGRACQCGGEAESSRRVRGFNSFQDKISQIKTSKWKFILDCLYILILIHVCTCMTFSLSFLLVMMDFAQTKGFSGDSAGTFFLFIVFVINFIGRLVVGPLTLIPRVHTICLMAIFGIISSVGMVLLGSATDYTTIVCFLGLHGLGIGGVLAINPKCVLDLDSVSVSSYPLALGLNCTMEGIANLVIPVLIGYTVDIQGSYTMILRLLGSISLLTSFALLVGPMCRNHKKKNSLSRSHD